MRNISSRSCLAAGTGQPDKHDDLGVVVPGPEWGRAPFGKQLPATQEHPGSGDDKPVRQQVRLMRLINSTRCHREQENFRKMPDMTTFSGKPDATDILLSGAPGVLEVRLGS